MTKQLAEQLDNLQKLSSSYFKDMERMAPYSNAFTTGRDAVALICIDEDMAYDLQCVVRAVNLVLDAWALEPKEDE